MFATPPASRLPSASISRAGSTASTALVRRARGIAIVPGPQPRSSTRLSAPNVFARCSVAACPWPGRYLA
ncbi:hypothetical protein ACNF49_05125 [Actinomadura sp. ATCC 39365]